MLSQWPDGSKMDNRSSSGTDAHINTGGSRQLMFPYIQSDLLLPKLTAIRDMNSVSVGSRHMAILPHSAHRDTITKQEDGPYGGLVLQTYCAVAVISST